MTALTVVAKRGEDIVAVTLYERYVVTLRTLAVFTGTIEAAGRLRARRMR